MPTPIAPVNTASADRSMPTELSTITTAIVITLMRINLPISAWIDGVSVGNVLNPAVEEVAGVVAPHSASSSSATVLSTSSGVTRSPPDHDRAGIEHLDGGGSSRPRMLQRRDGPGRDRDQRG